MFPDPSSFSPRELEIIRLISGGLSNKEIGQRLFISSETVKWYTKQIYPKLEVSNRILAAKKAREIGLLDGDSGQTPEKRSSSVRSNLPAPLTGFVGRRKALADLAAALRGARLVTITGPGGIGKTRLAIEFAALVQQRFPDGVWLVELSHLTDPDEVPATIAAVLGVGNRGDDTPNPALKGYLAYKRLLVVLDNFEHLLPAAGLLPELLESAHGLSILVTSRELLDIYGEFEYRLEPLHTPDPGSQAALESESVQLFLDRAQDEARSISRSGDAASQIGEICRLLDGLPLAIELAVPMLKVFSLSQLAEYIRDGLDSLPPGPRNLPKRQKTLRAAFEWSYRLLDDDQKTLLKVLSVFSDRATLDAIRVVSGMSEGRVLNGVYALVNRNLVNPKEGLDGEIYFTMLRTTTVFAREKCAEDERLPVFQKAHGDYYLALSEAARNGFVGANHRYWLIRIQREHGNFREAIRRSISRGDLEAALSIPTAMRIYWRDVGYLREGYYLIQEILESRGKIGTAARSRALLASADFAIDLQLIDEADSQINTALAVFENIRELESIAWCCGILAGVRMIQDRMDESLEKAYQCLAVFEKLGDAHGLAFAQNLLGEIARTKGDFLTAEKHYHRSLSLARSHGILIRALAPSSNLGAVLNRQGRIEESEKLYKETIRMCLQLDTRFGVAYEVGLLAGPTLSLGKREKAVRLLAASNTQLEAYEFTHQHIDQVEFLHIYQQAKELLDEDSFQKAWEEGRHMTVQEAAEYALSEEK